MAHLPSRVLDVGLDRHGRRAVATSPPRARTGAGRGSARSRARRCAGCGRQPPGPRTPGPGDRGSTLVRGQHDRENEARRRHVADDERGRSVHLEEDALVRVV